MLPSVLASLAAATAVAFTAPAAHAATPSPRCVNADLPSTADDLPAIRTALLCLHNRERSSHGLHPLKGNARLQAVADAHATEMLDHGSSTHASADGTSFSSRIIHGGYGAQSMRVTLGENLASGAGGLVTPAELMNAWMHSPGHRATILTPAFRDIGIGVSFGGSGPDLTVTADFGARR